jgi:hypothetical protein
MKVCNLELSISLIIKCLKIYASFYKLKLYQKEKLYLVQRNCGMKIDTTHLPYLKDLIPNFDYYYNSVDDFIFKENLKL